MCGIAGIISLNDKKNITPDQIAGMVNAIQHRGPDGIGIYVDEWAGLGQARLSIIDLAGGAQPIHNENGNLWIVYNGEVFNYLELREDLVKKGHRFTTATDTEVVLHLYEEKGQACLQDLNGQFAMAIWDSRTRELFLARDRMGILPLHYTISNGRFLFGSEVKALFAVEGVPRAIDHIALDQIFTFWTTLPGRTAFKDIQELPPGHVLRLSSGAIHIERYWELPFTPPEEHRDGPFDDVCQELRDLILDAVRIRLRADVPVGCYLSGGLDSSGITTLVQKNFNNKLRTFGIRFEEPEFDEGTYQQYMVSCLGTDHTELLATNDEIGRVFSSVLRHCEKPLLRTSPAPLHLLSRVVRNNGYKVVLTGEGADEVFGGYNIFREAKVRRFWARQPGSAVRPLLIGRLYPYLFQDNPRGRHFIQSFFGRDIGDIDDPFYSHAIRWQNTERLKTFYSAELRQKIGDYSCCDDLRQSLPRDFSRWDYLSKAQYLESVLFLSTFLLSSQGDRVAMSHGVEIRPPFLDHRIIEFMSRVPAKWKIRGLNEKYILKSVFRDIVPKQIIDRPKHPYRAPIHKSLLTTTGSKAAELLMGPALKDIGLFDVEKVGRLVQKINTAGQASEMDNMALAGIASTQLVFDQFVRNFQPETEQSNHHYSELLIDKRRSRSGASEAGAARGQGN